MPKAYADAFNPWSTARAATEYVLDAWQRTILTWDVMRERCSQPEPSRDGRSASGEPTAEMLRLMSPARIERWYFSELNPWMAWIKMMADALRKDIRSAPTDNPFTQLERGASRRITQSLDLYGKAHDDAIWLNRVVRESTCA